MTALHDFGDTGRLHTLRDWLRFAVSAFQEAGLSFGHGSASAYDEAAYLILHTLHLPLDTLEPFLDAQLTGAECSVLHAMLEKRVQKRLPAAYLTHEAWLGEFRFYVDERVIVPRSFIAELLRDQFVPWVADPDGISRVLDLCTGSGCLAILAAHAFPNAEIDAVDISPDALEVARRNIDDYDLQERVHLIQSNLFASLQVRQYDLIISNPPYIPSAEIETLQPEVRDYDPRTALDGGADGLDFYRRLAVEAAPFLQPLHDLLQP